MEAEVRDLKLALTRPLSSLSAIWLAPPTSPNVVQQTVVKSEQKSSAQVKVLLRSHTHLLLMQVAHVSGWAELLAVQAKCRVSGAIKQTEVSTKAPIFPQGAPHFYGL